jgi:flagellar biosynthesis/type III secretory pathway chaperone
MTADPQPLLDALAGLLEQEYAALRRADAAAVTAIAARKRALTAPLAGLHLPDAGELPPGARHAGARCRDLNRRNGELLHLQQGMLTQALRVLSGADPAPTVYGARGQTQGDAGGRHIGSACRKF